MALRSALFGLSMLPLIIADFAMTPIHDLKLKSSAAKSGNADLIARQAETVQSDAHNVDPKSLYQAHTIQVPIDHFLNESRYEPHGQGYFELRYWFDATYYQTGGPVILLASGEDVGEARLPYMQKGILAQLSQATNGLGVVLEHRFYGESMPTSDLSTESLRFLTTQQALADTAYFAQNVVFEGIQDNLKAPHVPWIVYGGSYAGAFAAFLRKTYPDVFFGAIASSAVVEAVYDFWDYYTPVMTYGPTECIVTTQLLTNVIDNILINKADYTNDLQSVFGLQGLSYPTDFANVLSNGIGAWQSQSWDPALNSGAFDDYCSKISSNETLDNPSSTQTSTVETLLSVAGYGDQSYLVNRMNNFIGWTKTTKVDPCLARNETVDSCFSTHNSTFYEQDDITQKWRSWPYQYCSEWGFLTTGSGFPSGYLPVISRTLDLDFQTKICRDAFGITTPANVSIINAYGGYDISYPRLAFVDGQADPWIGASVHAVGAPARANTTLEPSMIIQGAIHHWDENGIFANESTAYVPPSVVSSMQDTECYIVREWLSGSHVAAYSKWVVNNGTVGLAGKNETTPSTPPPSPPGLVDHLPDFIVNGTIGLAEKNETAPSRPTPSPASIFQNLPNFLHPH